MSVGLINRKRLKEVIHEAAAEWQINRQRIPTRQQFGRVAQNPWSRV